jgi:hypothetical protein
MFPQNTELPKIEAFLKGNYSWKQTDSNDLGVDENFTHFYFDKEDANFLQKLKSNYPNAIQLLEKDGVKLNVDSGFQASSVFFIADESGSKEVEQLLRDALKYLILRHFG